MQEIYYTSDFKITETGDDYTHPFSFVYFCTGGSNQYKVSYDGETYSNCKVSENGGLIVYFVNHNMSVGQLMVEKSFLHVSADGNHFWEKRNAHRKDITLTLSPITIKAEVVEDNGVELSNITQEVIRDGREKAVKLSGDVSFELVGDGVKLY